MGDRIAYVEELTHQAVRWVFQSMLSMELANEPPSPLAADPDGQIIGSVGFIGQTTGVIHLYTSSHSARVLTGRILGISGQEVESDEIVNDAIGELSNMVAGFVKSRLCDNGLPCTLTIPSVVRGQQLSVARSAQASRKALAFRNGDLHLIVELLLRESQTTGI